MSDTRPRPLGVEKAGAPTAAGGAFGVVAEKMQIEGFEFVGAEFTGQPLMTCEGFAERLMSLSPERLDAVVAYCHAARGATDAVKREVIAMVAALVQPPRGGEPVEDID